jgi:8-oxo-dGTP pyrophosphatase MutT (NUDIX family)
MQRLHAHAFSGALFDSAAADLATTSAVLVLVGVCGPEEGASGEACFILNKRSAGVRQPGDLCFPGGGVAPHLDFRVGRILGLPLAPLGRWPFWWRWRRRKPFEARWLRLYLATALREAFEEMRLNPLRTRFLGPLPPQRLVLFRRMIYPMAVWVPRQKRFKPNWEVERIIRIPLRGLLDPKNYVRYRVSAAWPSEPETVRDVPGFRWTTPYGAELLWGATFRITMRLLNIALDFTPPAIEELPQVSGCLPQSYLNSPVGRAF